jgi:hypothetical protein
LFAPYLSLPQTVSAINLGTRFILLVSDSLMISRKAGKEKRKGRGRKGGKEGGIEG